MTKRLAVDIGNSRLKWGLIRGPGKVVRVRSLPLRRSSWERAWAAFGFDADPPEVWLSSVNPPRAREFLRMAECNEAKVGGKFERGSDVPLRHAIRSAETAGADRALAVVAALGRKRPPGPGLVVLCGTAITVERIAADGTWEGGAIAPGLILAARSLRRGTAQLPLVGAEEVAPSWGDSTLPALQAGVFWGTVGGVRELVGRVSRDWDNGPSWILWSGGDARRLAAEVVGPSTRVVPNLVLRGLARLASSEG